MKKTKPKWKLSDKDAADVAERRFYKEGNRVIFILGIDRDNEGRPYKINYFDQYGCSGGYEGELKDLKIISRQFSYISNTELIGLITQTEEDYVRNFLFRYSRQLAPSRVRRDISMKNLNRILHEGQQKTYSEDIGRFIDSIDDRPESW